MRRRGAARADEELEALFRAAYAPLVRLLSFGGDSAADAVQEAFVQAFVHWQRVRRLKEPVAWVRRVAVNRLLNQQRDARRREEAVARVAVESTSPSQPGGLADEVVTALEGLPPQQRIAVQLFYLGALSTAEVADTMVISDGAVRFHLHEARNRLRRELGVPDVQ